jgi:hypothetical protein
MSVKGAHDPRIEPVLDQMLVHQDVESRFMSLGKIWLCAVSTGYAGAWLHH